MKKDPLPLSSGFLSSSWHIKNKGMFAASCIGIVLLVVSLEALRRLSAEFEHAMHRQWRAHAAAVSAARQAPQRGAYDASPARQDTGASLEEGAAGRREAFPTVSTLADGSAPSSITYRPTPLQQLIRAVLHAMTFGVAYIIMLLAMYFNGFVIISIILGAGLGKFLCDWKSTTIAVSLGSRLAAAGQCPANAGGKGGAKSAEDGDSSASLKSGHPREPTVCCG